MAKYNLFLGTAKGKVGDVVMYRLYGEQCSRARVREISNPKTEAQQIQRSIAATVTQAYSALKTVCNHSWENVAYKGRSMNYFNKLNMKKVRSQYAQYAESGDYNGICITAPSVSTYIPNEYIISKGSLENPLRITALAGGSSDTTATTGNNDYEFDASETTFGDFLEHFGLVDPKSMYTLINVYLRMNSSNLLYNYNNDDAYGASVYDTVVEISRAIRNDEIISDEMLETLVDVEDVSATFFEPYFKDWNTSSNNMQYVLYQQIETESPTSVSVTKSDTISSKYQLVSSQIIKSQYDDTDGWKRSSEKMVISSDEDVTAALGLYPKYATEAWTEGTESIGDSEYLLNASEDE